jgi:hypothetical protein
MEKENKEGHDLPCRRPARGGDGLRHFITRSRAAISTCVQFV